MAGMMYFELEESFEDKTVGVFTDVSKWTEKIYKSNFWVKSIPVKEIEKLQRNMSGNW